MKKRVLLGMSGGVDSSVSAILLQEAGYDVIGATMRLWESDNEEEQEGGCCSFSAVYDAKRVCDKLGIPHYTINFKDQFKKCVVNDFINCYKNAKTPNPCIECNKHIKFNLFMKKAEELSCDYIATGHYAKVEYLEDKKEYVLKKSNAVKKDQTYFLYSIPKEVLSKVIFPLSNYEDKGEIRQIAKEHELLIAQKPDSQEVCFIPDNNYIEFLKENLEKEPKKGDIILTDGTILGKHNGLINYTVGQRKGLKISYKTPLYVIKLDKEKNQVIVGEEKELYSNVLYAEELNFLVNNIEYPLEVNAKIRYRAKEAKAIIEKENNETIKVTFVEPQRAITPGQSVVFYKDDIVIGGGKIKNL